MSLADPSAREPHPALAAMPHRVTVDGDPRRADDLLAALRGGRSPVFARWPDPGGTAIIGSARSATGAAALAFDCACGSADFEAVRIEFEFRAAARPPVRILAEAWIPV